MKTTSIIAALALGALYLPAQEEIKKPEPAQKTAAPAKPAKPGENTVTVGPITVTTSVTGDVKTEKTKKSAYLGVVTGPVTAPVRAQVGLSEGMGLSIEAVAKDSPAEKAGLKQYDVLKKFNDQMLCTSDQLAALVNAAGKDAKVALTFMRNGAEQNVSVTLGERTVQVPSIKVGGSWSLDGGPQFDIHVDNFSGAIKGLSGDPGRFSIELQKSIAKQRKEIEGHARDIAKQAEEAARRAREAAGQAASTQSKSYSFYPETHASTQSHVVTKDADGEIQIDETNGKSTVKIRDAKGADIYNGPLNNEDDYSAVPEKFRDKVRGAAKNIKKAQGKPILKAEPGKKTKGESI